jgi:hypothetical protein
MVAESCLGSGCELHHIGREGSAIAVLGGGDIDRDTYMVGGQEPERGRVEMV